MPTTLVEQYTNYANTTQVSGGTTAPASGTQETWTVASSASFPPASSTAGTGFHVSDPNLPAEVIAVINVSGVTWTVLRGAENTTPVAHTAGFTIKQVVTAGVMNSLRVVIQPSGDTTGATDVVNINNQLSNAGIAFLAAGQFYTNAQITVPFNGQLSGTGRQTVINFVGSGACVYMHNPTNPTGFASTVSNPAGGIRDLVIDGFGSSGSINSTGLDIGDGWGYRIDNVWVRGFANTAGSIGIWEANRTFWTEKAVYTNVDLWYNSLHFKADQLAGAKPSHEFNEYHFKFRVSANQTAIQITNGAYMTNCEMHCKGNFIAGINNGPNTGAFLKIGDGSNTTGSSINYSLLVWQFEANQNVSTDTHFHQTMVLDTDTQIHQCWGQMVFNSFSNNIWVQANFDALTASRFAFSGLIAGDSKLSAAGAIFASQGGAAVGGLPTLQQSGVPIIYAQNSLAAGVLKTGHGDFFTQILTANITIDLTGGDAAGCTPGPQRKIIVLTQDATGGRTVTWPSPGSPTILLPKVKWAGGTAPVQTAAANATDIYEITTFDGITWYGNRIAANVS